MGFSSAASLLGNSRRRCLNIYSFHRLASNNSLNLSEDHLSALALESRADTNCNSCCACGPCLSSPPYMFLQSASCA